MESEQSGKVGCAPWRRGVWLRRRYFVQDDRIRPIPGSAISEYRPLPLVNSADRDPGEDVSEELILALKELDLGSEDAIERFARRWGLLGLFSHHLHWQRYIPGAAGEVQPLSRSENAGHVEEGLDFRAETSVDASQASLERWNAFLASAREVNRQGWPGYMEHGCGTVLNTMDSLFIPQPCPLMAYYAPFFPDLDQWRDPVTDRPVFPALDSRELWDRLCEPLQAFRLAVREFQSLAELFARGAVEKRPPSPPPMGFIREPEGAGIAAIRRHTRRVSPLLTTRLDEAQEPPWELRWFCPSLLAAAYVALEFKVTGKLPPRLCRNCGRYFFPGRASNIYCRRQCANTDWMRSNRAPQTEESA